MSFVEVPRLVRPLAMLVFVACGPGGGEVSGPPVPPPPAAVASVDVQPTTATINPGQTLQLTATPRDAAGAALSRSVTWSTEHSYCCDSLQHRSGHGCSSGFGDDHGNE
jgi:hypothetical protein